VFSEPAEVSGAAAGPGQLALFDDGPYRRRPRRWRLATRARAYRSGRVLLAGGLIMDEQGRILLLHRSTPTLSQWETPGGKVDGRESPDRAAARELREELGVDVRVVGDWGTHEIDSGDGPLTYALFQVEVAEGTPRVNETDKFDDVRFFRWQELVELARELSPNALNLLHMHWRGQLRPRPVVDAKAASQA
jgi:8-oxo-dGTP diphosphatase